MQFFHWNECWREVEMLKYGCLILILFSLSSCAMHYRNIHPSTLDYLHKPSRNGIIFSYKTDVLSKAGNRNLARKESQNGIDLIAIRIVNKTRRSLDFSSDLELRNGEHVLNVLNQGELTSQIRETAPGYLIYLILTPLKLNTENKKTNEFKSYNIGYILGPLLAGINIGIALDANKSFRKELDDYDMSQVIIQHDEIIYGLIGIKNYDGGELTLHLK